MIGKQVLGIAFSNMRDFDLGKMTAHRTIGSVPFGGRYRLVDFALSNMVNAGISNVGVITQTNYQSLMDHLSSGREWDLSRKRGGLRILPPYASLSGKGEYRGTLEALYGAMGFIRHSTAEYVVVTGCDYVLNIDFTDLFEAHEKSGADITVVYRNKNIEQKEEEHGTVFQFNRDGMVNDVMVGPVLLGNRNLYMSILIMKKSLLESLVEDNVGHDRYSMRRNVLLAKYNQLKIYGFEYKDYCAHIHNLNSYYQANMELLIPSVRTVIFRQDRPIYTKVRDEVPAKYGLSALVGNSLVADGSIINGEIENSVIFRGVHIGKGAKVKNCILMQGTIVGENVTLDSVITDKNVVIREGRTLVGFETYPIYINKNNSI